MLSITVNKCASTSRIFLTKNTLSRSLSARSKSNDNNNNQTNEVEWNNAKPFSAIPGPNRLQMLWLFSKNGELKGRGVDALNSTLRARYGNLMRLPSMFGKRDMVYSFDPKHFEIIFRTEGQWPIRRGIEVFDYYRKKVRPDVFKGMGGLVSDQGEDWAKLRKAVNPVMMQPKVIKTYILPVDQVTREFIQKIHILRDRNDEMPSDFGNELNQWALESIGVIALDERLGVMKFVKDPESEQIITAVRDFFQVGYELEVEVSLWRYYETKKYKKVISAFDIMTSVVKKYVDTALDRMDKLERDGKTDPNCNSVLHKLLKINRHYAVLMAMDMLFAGIDTTASAAATLLHHLAMNPDKQEKLREEVFKVLPTIDTKMTTETLNNLPYLRACLKESLRIQPVAQGNLRAAGKNIVLDGYQIPKDKNIAMSGVTVQNDDKYFPESIKFMPERWLRDETTGCPAARAVHPFVNLPFGFGPRMCIGRRFAELEIYILMLRLLREYKVEWHHPPIVYHAALIVSPNSDLKFKFIRL